MTAVQKYVKRQADAGKISTNCKLFLADLFANLNIATLIIWISHISSWDAKYKNLPIFYRLSSTSLFCKQACLSR